MPYNTRRKSLSLPSLGIQLPQSSRAYVAKCSPPVSLPPRAAEQPPSKRVKRSHSSPSPPTPLNASQRRAAPAYEQTPPPSPRPSCDGRVDIDGVDDEIVVAVIQQLERTGNKPQLVKELAAILSNSLDVVERCDPETRTALATACADATHVHSSANPQAIISSRLNSYLKRSWTAQSPCPLAKTLIPTHPRRIYFHLTSRPHQALPAASSESPLPSNRRVVISPSLSSDEDQEARRRAAPSPSPEVDLSNPDLEDDEQGPPTPAGTFSGRSSLARDGSQPDSDMISRRAVSPPLEGDEREFTQTASVMQSKRSMSSDERMAGDGDTIRTSVEDGHAMRDAGDGDGVDRPDQRISEAAAAAALFGQQAPQGSALGGAGIGIGMGMSSPLVRPSSGPLHINTMLTSPSRRRILTVMTEVDVMGMDLDDAGRAAGTHPELDMAWTGEMRSPENVELAELDDLLGGF